MSVDHIVPARSSATTPESDTAEVTVSVKPCCGVLAGDECDCAAFAAEARGVFARPIMCRPASQWGTQS